MRSFFTPRALVLGSLLLPLLFASCKPGDSGTTPTPSGIVVGRIVNALTAAAVAGATVDFGSGRTTSTNSTGEFSISLPVGTYTATVSGSAFATSTIPDIVVVADQTTELGTRGISPPLPEGQVRIILTWTARRDLDSHLKGPLANSTNRFHIYFASRGSLTATPFAYLDRDDLVGPGPETVTITQPTVGTYHYAVHDFTGGNSQTSTALSSSGARVLVIRGSNQVAEYRVPVNVPGTLWTVFAIDGATGNITPINTMSGQAPTTLQSVIPGTVDWRADARSITETVAAQPKH